jgi:hypothetical protein
MAENITPIKPLKDFLPMFRGKVLSESYTSVIGLQLCVSRARPGGLTLSSSDIWEPAYVVTYPVTPRQTGGFQVYLTDDETIQMSQKWRVPSGDH